MPDEAPVQASAAAAKAAPAAKPALSAEARLAALEEAVYSLGMLSVTQAHDGLEGFIAWAKAKNPKAFQ